MTARFFINGIGCGSGSVKATLSICPRTRRRTGPGAPIMPQQVFGSLANCAGEGLTPGDAVVRTATLRPVRMPQRSSRRAGQVVP